MMAEVMMGKTSILSPSSSINHQRNYHHQNHGTSVSVFRATKSSSGFSSLKLSPLSLLRRSPFSSSSSSSFNTDFHGPRFLLPGRLQQGIPNKSFYSVTAQMSIGIIGKALKWWEKGIQPNMKEVKGAQDLVESLFNAGDKLVVVDFFSPGCGGCKALHPKICQQAEMNPDVQFLQVNYEEHKSMCYSLNVHVLPFFRFYRGAHGRLCSFSCTNATIKKFKDALAKHSPDRCSLGPPKGLEEKELLALAANKDLCFNFTPKPKPKPEQPMPVPAREEILLQTATVPAPHSEAEPPVSLPLPLPLPSTTSSNAARNAGDKTLVTSGR